LYQNQAPMQPLEALNRGFYSSFFVRVLLGWVAMRIKKERAPARDANPVPITPNPTIFLENSP